MQTLEHDTRAELLAAADSLEALLEAGMPDPRDMLALVSRMRDWGREGAPASATLH